MTPETQIRTLQADLATAHETIRQLRDLLRPNPMHAQAIGIDLTKQENALLMLCYEKDYVRHDQVIAAWGTPVAMLADPMNSMKVQMCRLRKKLDPHDIHIDTIWGVGWKMTPENKAKLKALFSSADVGAN